jgi:FkbM family methyltransferase
MSLNVVINGNNVRLSDGTSIKDLLSSKFLRVEKFNLDVEVNGGKVNQKNYNNSLYNLDSITIKINSKEGVVVNLTRTKRIVYSALRLLKTLKIKIRNYSSILRIKIILHKFLTPYYTLKFNNSKFYVPNNRILGLSANTLDREADTTQWIDSFNKDDVFVDIGASMGVYSIYAGIRGHNVISFEPLWSSYSVLCENIILNNIFDKVTPLNVALTDRTRIEKLSISSADPGGSHNSLDVDVAQSTGVNSGINLKIMGGTIDHIWNEFNLPIPNHIKIDVDGIEEKILYGGKSILSSSKVHSVLVEVSILETNQCNNVINFLGELGFSLESVIGVKMKSIDFSKLSKLSGSFGVLNLIFYR